MDYCNNETILEQAREIESLRQQLSAALAACEAKDVRFKQIMMMANHLDVLSIAMQAHNALAIKPDASALRQHDEALIERCAAVCEEYVDRIEAKRDEKYQAEYAGRQAGATRCAAAIRELKEEL